MALQLLQQNASINTASPEFRNFRLSDSEYKYLAYRLIESYPFLGANIPVHNSKNQITHTKPVMQGQVEGIKKYLKAFIDVDRSALETFFQGFNAANAKRRMIYQIINERHDLYRLYVEYKRDVVERSMLCLLHDIHSF
jgi:hypothetical protein